MLFLQEQLNGIAALVKKCSEHWGWESPSLPPSLLCCTVLGGAKYILDCEVILGSFAKQKVGIS